MAIASRFDQEKHFAAASRHGSHSKAVCSSFASRTSGRAASSRANTCSTLWMTPGAMRQWGRHATAFVGRRHFDDADLIERRFQLDLPEPAR